MLSLYFDQSAKWPNYISLVLLLKSLTILFTTWVEWVELKEEINVMMKKLWNGQNSKRN